MAEGEDGERPPSPDDSFWGVSGANGRGVDSDGLEAGLKTVVVSQVVEGLVGGALVNGGLVGGCLVGWGLAGR